MELTKTKLHNILKKYRAKLEQHDNEWKAICKAKWRTVIDGDHIEVTTPSIYDHQSHTAKGSQLFRDMMAEFDGYEVFTKKNKVDSKGIADTANSE